MTKPSKLNAELVEGLAVDIRDLPADVKCTWQEVERLVQKRGSTVTRQWLSKHPGIVSAYEAARQARRLAKKTDEKRSPPENELVACLRGEIKILKGIIEGYDKLFLRYLHNATQHGITLSELQAPLPVMDGKVQPMSAATRSRRRGAEPHGGDR